jgi:starch phosphorylase
VRLPHAGLLGYTVRVLPQHPRMASPAEFGLLHLAT